MVRGGLVEDLGLAHGHIIKYLFATSCRTVNFHIPENLPQRIERGADLRVGRTLLVVRLDLYPTDFAFFGDDVNGRMRNPVNVLSFIGFVTQTVRVDDRVFWIGEQGKVKNAFPIRRDLVGQGLARFVGIRAYRVDFYVLVFLQD